MHVALPQSSVVMRRLVKNPSHPMYVFPAEAEQGNALPPCVSFHNVKRDKKKKKVAFHGLFNATFFTFFCYLLVIPLFQMAPEHNVP